MTFCYSAPQFPLLSDTLFCLALSPFFERVSLHSPPRTRVVGKTSIPFSRVPPFPPHVEIIPSFSAQWKFSTQMFFTRYSNTLAPFILSFFPVFATLGLQPLPPHCNSRRFYMRLAAMLTTIFPVSNFFGSHDYHSFPFPPLPLNPRGFFFFGLTFKTVGPLKNVLPHPFSYLTTPHFLTPLVHVLFPGCSTQNPHGEKEPADVSVVTDMWTWRNLSSP